MDYHSIQHEVGLAAEVLVLGISHTKDMPENHYDRVAMRATLTLLEGTLVRLRRKLDEEGTNHA